MERWVGRVALVTGASVGIGASICEVLVQSGLKVVGAARGVEKVQTLSETLKDAKGSLLPVKCDLTKEEDIRNLFDKIKKEFGGVDICINNAGLGNGNKLLDSTVEEMREMIDVNIIALCLCSQLAIASLRERGVDDGHVININSISGHVMTPFTSSRFYASTKFAVRAITEGLRQEMRELKSHIRISTLSETLKDAKGSLLPVKCDLTKEEDIRKLFDKIKKEFGGVDICINNAGLSNGKKLLDSTVEEMRELTNVNIIALCLCSQLAIASMRERGVDDGHVINISSIGGHRLISPGMVNTQFAYRAFKDPERAKNLYSSIEPLRPEDVAASVLHVISAPPHVERVSLPGHINHMRQVNALSPSFLRLQRRMERWTGRVALVTGASVGIGATVCEALVRSGLKVVGAARGVDQALSESLKDAKGSLLPIKCDLTKESDIRNLFNKIKEEFGGVDICINNAGLSNGKKLLEGTVEEMREMTDVNIIALCLCSQLAIKSMKERGVDDGHIINISRYAIRQ
ncbi:Dehydrogenase/reductase SDR family member 11 [Armadillidium nasatum]|uniref:Dehydrogenase/reductase SDR family member 11 n=1 Tax=Armadillidium nasatum TaxID=96803 RepID=A0A5N5TEN0_9CRUS|nr:Dehydrogenase/reductase SDR family member 11 [Armadillidium nasatum]